MTSRAFAALLRGINVGGHKKVPMAELRSLLTGLGLGQVRTYLQSGNAAFTSAHDQEALASLLGRAMAEHFGFDVEVLVRDHAYLQAVADGCPFPSASLEGRQLHVTYLSVPVAPSAFASLDAADYLPEEFRLGDRVVYHYAPEGLGRSKLAAALATRTPDQVIATSRNWNTVAKLVELTRA